MLGALLSFPHDQYMGNSVTRTQPSLLRNLTILRMLAHISQSWSPASSAPQATGVSVRSVIVILFSAPFILEETGKTQAGDKQDAAKPSMGHA